MSKSKDWTEARKHSFIVSTLRAGMRRWPPKYEALKAAFTEKKTNKVSNRQARHYKCAKCKEDFASTNVQVDHVKPIVDPKKGFVSWDDFIKRLFVEIKGLQVLCKPCHKEKTQQERAKRTRKVK